MKTNNIPKLRFPEFDRDWEIDKLENLTLKIGDGLHGTPNYVDNSDVYFVNGNNLVDGRIKIFENTKKIDEKTYILNNKNLTHNSILISINGTIGNISKFNNEKIMLGKSIAYLNFRQNSDFFYFLLNSDKIKNYFISELTGSTIKNLSLKTLRETNITYPLLPEQQKIASFLTTVDDKISNLKQKVSLLEKYKKGVMQQIFSQQIRFKDTSAGLSTGNGNDYPDWEEKKIKDVLKIGSGRDYKHLKIGNIPVFGTGGLMTYIDSFLYDGETVCIGRKGTIDKPMYYNGKIWTVDTLFYTYDFIHSNPKFIFYIFQNINWKEYNEASGVPSLSKSTIEKIDLKIPSIEEQTKIAEFLSGIDDKIETTKLQLNKMEVWKKGLLQGMFC